MEAHTAGSVKFGPLLGPRKILIEVVLMLRGKLDDLVRTRSLPLIERGYLGTTLSSMFAHC